MSTSLPILFPELPRALLHKTDLMFRGVRYSESLGLATRAGAAPGFWPYRKHLSNGQVEAIQIPYMFRLADGGVARVRVDDASPLEVGGNPDEGYTLIEKGTAVSSIGFVGRHAWQNRRTDDGVTPFAAGVSQLGDMIVVNAAPGCEYFRLDNGEGQSSRCCYCGYGRFDRRSEMLGQVPGEPALSPDVYRRLEEVMKAVADVPEVRHVYLTGGSMTSPDDEAKRYLPIIETVRRAVGTRLRVTVGSGAVSGADSQRYREAGADSCCYNLEVWDPEKFQRCCPGKSVTVGRERWIEWLYAAVDIFGSRNVGSAFVAGLELRPPGRVMSDAEMLASILEGACTLMDRGVVPLYSPLWPVEHTVYKPEDGLDAALFLQLQVALYREREKRHAPVPGWIICPDCSYMLLEVDFDRALGLAPKVG